MNTEIFKNCAIKYKDRIAIIDEKNNIRKTYEELYKEIICAAKTFIKKDIKPNDKICIFSENNGNWLAIEQGIENCGAVSVLRGSKLSPIAELKYIYNNSDAVGLITDSIEVLEEFIKTESDFCSRNKIVGFFGNKTELKKFNDENILSFEEIINLAKDEKFQPVPLEENSPAIIVYSSGTSGIVKGVMLSHYSISYIAEVTQRRIKLKEKKQTFLVNPLWHSGPYVNNTYTMSIGSTVIYLTKNTYMEALKKYKPENLEMVPKTFDNLYNAYQDIINNYDPIHKNLYNISYDIALKYRNHYGVINNKFAREIHLPEYLKSLVGTAILFIPNLLAKIFYLYPLRRKIVPNRPLLYTAGVALDRHVEDFFNLIGITTYQKYGLSESCSILTNQHANHSKYYTVGLPHEGVEIKVVDFETQETLPPYKTGVIYAKGPHIMLGYYNNKEATDKILGEDGFLNTGDVGFIDKDGFITYISRCKDIIILQNGENTDAISIEAKCREIPYIKQIIMCGQDKIYLTAIVVLREGVSLSKEQILSDINEKNQERENFKKYEKIKDIIIFNSDEIDLDKYFTNTQKLKRYKIYEDFAKEIEDLYK